MDRDALSAILVPLDLAPVFQVPSGDLLRGIRGHEPGVDVRGVHSATFGAALGPGRSQETLDLELLDRGMVVRLSSLSPRRFADRLLAGDVDLLEEVHAAEPFAGSDALADLRRIAAPMCDGATVAALRKRGEEALSRAGADVRKRAREVLAALRWILSGLHLAKTGEIRPDLPSLAAWHGEGWLVELSARSGTEALSGSPAVTSFWLSEIEILRKRLRKEEPGMAARDRDAVRDGLEEWIRGLP
ncbi:MAG: hypothetical protein ABFS86_01105 [Planctomycetota bacterium]